MAITLRQELPLQDISSFFPEATNVSISLLRLDLLHPEVSGNKWFKLQRNLDTASAAGVDQVLTFGGAYSNHLVAAAVAASENGLRSVGVVRGLHAREALTPTLQTCLKFGMRLLFVSREDYSRKEEASFLSALRERFGSCYVIPEGGANEAGRQGAEDMAAFVPDSATHICVPVGTGTSFIGLRNALPVPQQLIGFPAMKGGRYLEPEIRQHLKPVPDLNWRLVDDYHFGGFGKCPPELRAFILAFYQATGIPLDVVYTGKMMWGIRDLLAKGFFLPGARIVALHTGGLQGNPAGLFPDAA